ncbi:aldo/keto reductase [Amnibacterium flavum]|uniref:aldo/keto reductase n=1 Tax=Amnibacterium flavum TaxID=2173173 RepID=UPI0036449CF6
MKAQNRVKIGDTGIEVFPLSLGGNVFGWTADAETSFDVLDGYAAAGGNLIDTADGYSAWVPGNSGGDSEIIIGDWMRSRGNRDDIVVATKVSQHPDFKGLSAANIRAAAEASLGRLGTDRIDVYYAHFDDASVPLAETVGAFSKLVDDGLVRAIGISNYSADRIDEWFAVTEQNGFHKAVALQPQYNLMERGFETELQGRAQKYGLGVFPYYALASGFLTGKYRSGSAQGDSPRAGQAAAYLDDRGVRVLLTLDQVASWHNTTVTAVALAWLRAQPTIVAPIASARTTDQLTDLLASATLELSSEEVEKLVEASNPL